MKIVAISDSHGSHHKINLPEGDVLCHSGDFSMLGKRNEVEDFFSWLHLQATKFKHVVFIAGNHDKSFDPKFNYEVAFDESERGNKPVWLKTLLWKLPPNVHYLEQSDVVIDGIKFWGSPITPWFGGHYWGFNQYRGDDIKKFWNQIPMDANVVLTHGPIAYKLDYVPQSNEYTGCNDLRYTIEMVKPLVHICGHIHEGYGIEGNEDTVFINASIMDIMYMPTNKPWLIEIKDDKSIKIYDEV